MTPLPEACPNCRSRLIRYRDHRNDWFCDECDHRWQSPSSAEPPSTRPRLFLSYGRRDASELANRLRVDLEREGYEVWQDTQRIHAGVEFELDIEDGLRSAQIVVAVLSPHAVRRAAHSEDRSDSVCLDEISFARFARPPRPIVPVMAVPCEPPFCIFRLDYVNLCAWSESEQQYQTGLKRLIEALDAAHRGQVFYREWDPLLKPWDFASFLNEKRRDFCGRDWLFDEIDAWRASSKEPALLITGDPGTGKSALVAELVHRNPRGQVLAYHCCQADTGATLEPAGFVRSIAAMIASQLPDYAALLADPVLKAALSDESCRRDPASAFEAGVLTPLQSLPAPEQGVRFLLVDALDEALSAVENATRANLVDLLASRLNRLPPWLRIVATSRKERAVLERLRGLRARELDAQDPRNLADLERYIADRLNTPNLAERLAASGLTAREVIHGLTEKSDGNFLYVQQSLQGIERDLYGFDQLGQLPPGLCGLYQSFFERHFAHAASFEREQSVLEVVVASREPLTANQIAAASGLDPEDQLPATMRKLAVYLPATEDRYALYHKSLADWLTDPSRRGAAFSVSPRRGHERLAQMGLREYGGGARRMSAYSLRHLPSHLAQAQLWDKLASVLGDLEFLERKVREGEAFALVSDFAQATTALPDDHPRRHLTILLEESLRADIHFIARHPSTLFQCFWNRCWWHDAPAARERYLPSPNDSMADTRAASPQELPLHELMERWRAEKSAREPGFFWLRSLRPPACHLGTAQLAVFAGHSAGVWAVSVSPNGRFIASASADCTIRIWDALSGMELQRLEGHWLRVTSLAFAPDSRTLASGSHDQTVRLWDALRGLEVASFSGHEKSIQAVAFSPDGCLVVSASWDLTVRVWRVDEGTERLCLRGHRRAIDSLAISPDGAFVASGDRDGDIRLWRLADGAPHAAWQGHAGGVESLAFLPNRGQLLSGGRDGLVRVWTLDPIPQTLELRAHDDAIACVAAAPHGEYFASASRDGLVRTWRTSDLTELGCYHGHRGVVRSLDFSPDGKHLVSGGDDATVRVWNVSAQAPRRLLAGDQATVLCAAISPDGSRVATGLQDGSIQVWNAAQGNLLVGLHAHAGPVSCLSFAPDSRTLASGGRDEAIKLWDLPSGMLRWELPGQGSAIASLQIVPSGRRVVFVTEELVVRVVDLDDGTITATLPRHSGPAWSVGVAPDGSTLYLGQYDGTIRAWDVETRQDLAPVGVHLASIESLAVSPSGHLLATSSLDSTVQIWDLARGELVRRWQDFEDVVRTLEFSSDEKVLVTAESNGVVRTWRLDSGEAIHHLQTRGGTWSLSLTDQLEWWRAAVEENELIVEHSASRGTSSWLPLRPVALHLDHRRSLLVAFQAEHVAFFRLEPSNDSAAIESLSRTDTPT